MRIPSILFFIGLTFITSPHFSLGQDAKKKSDTWKVVDFPRHLDGAWYKENGVPGYIHLGSHIMTANKRFLILETEKRGKDYRVLTSYEDRYYPFFFKNIQTDSFEFDPGRIFPDIKNGEPGFASQKLAKAATPRFFRVLNHRDKRRARIQPHRKFPDILKGTWNRENGESGFTFDGSNIISGNKKYRVVKAEKWIMGHRIITSSQSGYFTFFFRNPQNQSVKFSRCQRGAEATKMKDSPGFASLKIAEAAKPWEFEMLRRDDSKRAGSNRPDPRAKPKKQVKE